MADLCTLPDALQDGEEEEEEEDAEGAENRLLLAASGTPTVASLAETGTMTRAAPRRSKTSKATRALYEHLFVSPLQERARTYQDPVITESHVLETVFPLAAAHERIHIFLYVKIARSVHSIVQAARPAKVVQGQAQRRHSLTGTDTQDGGAGASVDYGKRPGTAPAASALAAAKSLQVNTSFASMGLRASTGPVTPGSALTAGTLATTASSAAAAAAAPRSTPVAPVVRSGIGTSTSTEAGTSAGGLRSPSALRRAVNAARFDPHVGRQEGTADEQVGQHEPAEGEEGCEVGEGRGKEVKAGLREMGRAKERKRPRPRNMLRRGLMPRRAQGGWLGPLRGTVSDTTATYCHANMPILPVNY